MRLCRTEAEQVLVVDVRLPNIKDIEDAFGSRLGLRIAGLRLYGKRGGLGASHCMRKDLTSSMVSGKM